MRHFSFSRPGRAWNEDRAYTCDDFIFVLDGATSLVKDQYSDFATDAEWCSNWWYEYLKDALCDMSKDIPDILKEGVVLSTKEFKEISNNIELEDCPCTTVSIVRRRNGLLEIYALADSPILLRSKAGRYLIVEDTLNNVNEEFNIMRIKNISDTDNVSMVEARQSHPEIIYRNVAIKNRFGGYYVLSNSIEAIEHGVYNYIEEPLIDKVIILSDGYSQVYDTIKFMTHEELMDSVDTVEDAETIYNKLYEFQESDIECNKYLRFKVRDDATMAFMQF